MDNLKDVKNSINSVINTDTISGKILFVLALLLIIYIVIRIVFIVMSYIYTAGSSEVTLLDGKIAGDQIKEFSQNPNDDADCTGSKCAKPLLLSKNALTGIEYTWSFWLNIDPEKSWFADSGTNYDITQCTEGIGNIPDQIYSCGSGGVKKAIHIFHKGASMEDKITDNTIINGIKLHNNAPGAYLAIIDHNSSNSYNIDSTSGIDNNYSIALLVYMDTMSGLSARRSPIVVPYIPSQKWFNVTLVAKQSTLYIYINGILKKLHTYNDVFKLNYESVHIGSSINYGELSSLKYWNRAISTFEINSLISKGPNLTAIDSRNYDDEYPRYLSMNWYNN